ncbi:MAG TPA: hypothetical protein VHO67_09860 [Polyangia bacterium]|nr:hypothetical protein [Polyangia bacterium]
MGNCAFTATYTISTDGYFARYMDKAVLSPPASYTHIKYFYPDGSGAAESVTCAPAIPPCTSGGPVSACDIAQDLADPAVQAALTQANGPFFERDTRAIDGTAFSFQSDDGHGFEVGMRCDLAYDNPTPSPCVPAPAGIARLKADLQKLDTELIASPECAALNVNLVTAGTI